MLNMTVRLKNEKIRLKNIENNKILADNHIIEAQKLLQSMDKIIDHALSFRM